MDAEADQEFTHRPWQQDLGVGKGVVEERFMLGFFEIGILVVVVHLRSQVQAQYAT